MQDSIKLYYTEGKTKYEGYVSRISLMSFMQHIVVSFPDNNEIAGKLVKVIPYMECMEIDKDVNETQDVPYIKYRISGKDNILKIIRHHKIMWSFLDNLCQIVKMS